MQDKPFDRFGDKPRRFGDDRFGDDNFGNERFSKPRFERNRFGDDNFGNRRPRFGGDRFENRGRFGDRDRFENNDRFGGDRFERNDRFGGDRGGYRGGFRKFDRPERGGRFIPSGPRAKAFESRRYADREAFRSTATVRLAPDVARYFSTPEAVNEALRALISIAGLVKEPKPEVEETENTAAVAADDQAVDQDEDVDAVPADDAADVQTEEAAPAADEVKPEQDK